ncbi:ABC transporter ATP-binding protein, partial [Streptomyces sp. Isolate_219]|nr:ABC transporter ATP-binding protein [Streptomyces sp. Isolate_219]
MTSAPRALTHDGEARLSFAARILGVAAELMAPLVRQEHLPVTTHHSGVATATRTTAAAARATDL